MDPTAKYYCRNVSQATALSAVSTASPSSISSSSSSSSSSTLSAAISASASASASAISPVSSLQTSSAHGCNAINITAIPPEYMPCEASHSLSMSTIDFNCKDYYGRNINNSDSSSNNNANCNKTPIHHQRNSALSMATMASASASAAASTPAPALAAATAMALAAGATAAQMTTVTSTATNITAGSYCSNNSSNSNNNSNSNNSTGNYINVMPVSMGPLQYSRRKLTPQEYQSRSYYNPSEYKCRDDYYTVGAGVSSTGSTARLGAASPSASLQLHAQQHQYYQQHHQLHQLHQHHGLTQQQLQQHTQELHVVQSQPQHHHHHQAQLNQQQVPHHYHNMPQHTAKQAQQQHLQQQQQQQQQQHLHHNHSHHHHQSVCSTAAVLEPMDDTLNCSLQMVPHNSRLMVAAQTQSPQHVQHPQNTGNCEQLIAPTALSLNTLSAVPAPLMYTVHRMVTTAQIQTATGNTFTSASSVSSVVSAARNETDNMGNVLTPMSLTLGAGNSHGQGPGNNSSNGGTIGACYTPNGSSQCSNAMAMTTEASGNKHFNGSITMANICTSPGTSTNINYLGSQTKQNLSSDAARITNAQYGTNTSSVSNINYTNNSTKASASSASSSSATAIAATSSVTRSLQDVIPTCVYLMSRVAVHMEIEGTAQCPSQVMLAAALGCEELGIANKLLAQSIFGLWMVSTLLEIQLKSHQRPFLVRLAWANLLEKFSHGNPIEKTFDEPMIMLKRNVFFSKRDEEKIKDHRILELLYEEAKHNVLTGRYIMESVHSLMLGGIQARIELGPFNSHIHTVSFFRENQSRFLPQHVAKNSSWSWLPISRKNSAEVRLLEQFKRVPQTATTRKLMRKYLEFCWALPFYGAAFFHGQVEQPVRGLLSMVNHKDIEVLIAVNERGVFIIDPAECTILLGLRYEDLSWDFAKPSATDDSECLTCIFLQFDTMENGIQISKLMQIFSRQAAMIDALIAHFNENMRKRKEEGDVSEQFHDEPNPIQNNGNGVLCNKLSRLTLATFDDEGRCIGQMGSLSISY